MMMQSNRPSMRRRGMTLLELSIGLVVTSMVIGALSAVWFAVGETWAKSGSSQSVSLTGAQAVARFESNLRPAKYIFQVVSGSTDGKTTPGASVFYWKSDSWNNTADGAVQVGELALIEHDPSTQKLYLYQAIPSASMTASQLTRASGVALWADLSSSATVTAFKSYDFVQKTVLSESVVGALFSAPSTSSGARPKLEYTLSLSRSGTTSLVYSVVSLRGPTTRPL
jgi:prepilin-type N-terminal cleavage/methylation domain-containing protein